MRENWKSVFQAPKIFLLLIAISLAYDSLFWRLAHANSAINGLVKNSVTGQTVKGVHLELSDGNNVLNVPVYSNQTGVYSLPFSLPSNRSGQLILKALHKDYAPITKMIPVEDGKLLEDNNIQIELMPSNISDCETGSDHSIVVGHFRPPAGKQIDEPAGRLVEHLKFNIGIRLQMVKLDAGIKPIFFPCEKVRPKFKIPAEKLAKLFKSHAFIYGNIDLQENSQSNFTVTTMISDAYGLLPVSHMITSENVNLNRSDVTSLDERAYSAVLGALSAGLLEEEDCESALHIIDFIEKMNARNYDLEYLEKVRIECKSSLPHSGLLF